MIITSIIKLQGQFQLNLKYPKTKKNNCNDILLNNQVRSFLAFKDQGYIWVKTQDLKNNKIFINGQRLPLKGIKKDYWNKLQINSFIKNGKNILQVNAFNKKYFLLIKVPYPKLIDFTKKIKKYKNDSLKLLDQIINSEIRHHFPSAQLVIAHNGKIIKKSSYGLLNNYTKKNESLSTGKKVNNETLYDLASNTKIFATNFALLKLVSEKKIKLDEKVNKFFPNFKDKPEDKIKGKSKITIKYLLQHVSGFPSDVKYYNIKSQNSFRTKNKVEQLYTQQRSNILKKIIATPLKYKPGTRPIYSDINFMLLGLVIEKITGQKLDYFVENNIYRPLNLKNITFNPLKKKFLKKQITATELNGNTRDNTVSFKNVRHYRLQGEVHDEKAFYVMNGVSGHAGLFSNASDLAKLSQVILNHGGYDNIKVFDEDTLDKFIEPSLIDPSFSLGWRRRSKNHNFGVFSNLSDIGAIGHTGWTGTISFIDFQENLSIILLTNKRNTPILNARKNPNDFMGEHYLIGKYGDILGLCFSVLNNDSKEANDQKIISLFIQKYNKIIQNKKYQTKADWQDLLALKDVLIKRLKYLKQNPAFLRDIINSNKWISLDKDLK